MTKYRALIVLGGTGGFRLKRSLGTSLKRTMALTITTLALLLGGAAPSSASSGCHPRRAQVLARNGAAVIFRRPNHLSADNGFEPLYSYYGCLTTRQRPTLLLKEGATEFGFAPTLVNHEPFPRVAWAGPYVAFPLDVFEIDECKYMQEPCSVMQVVSINLKTGRVAVDAQAKAGVVAVSSRGWTAWVEHGSRALRAVDSSSSREPPTYVQFLSEHPQLPRTLDVGPVAPRSVRIVGSRLEWASTTGRHSVALH